MKLAMVVSLGGCLDPAVGDEIDPTRVFGNAAFEPAQLPHVEGNPDLAKNVAQFPIDVPYVQGYASGRKVWYWRVPPPVKDFIVPFYVILGRDDAPLQPPIIDVIPGDTGYSPWWRVFTVKVTDRYAGERIYSREAVDLGVRLGILEAPVPSETVVTCPVVHSDTRVQVDVGGTLLEPTWAIYRDQRVSWLRFKSDISVKTTSRRMPLSLFYVLQRIDEPYPLSEPDAGFDLNGDGRMNNTNTIFQFDIGEEGYTPFWYPILVRTVPDFASIDTATTAIEFTKEDDFIGPVYGVVTSDRVVPPIVEMKDQAQNCPIQRTMGEL
jgi:hypothetical protein